MRIKITIAYKDKIKTFDQLPQGESRDELRGRALCAMGVALGDEYIWWEQEGYKYSGPVGDRCHGAKYVKGGERIPGLFVLVRGKVYDYREAPPR